MIAPRWKKALRDLAARRGRALLAVVAMAAGLFQIGTMLVKYGLLQPELTTMYGRTHPASAVLTLDQVSDGDVDLVRRMPEIERAEARPVVVTRARVGRDEWVPAPLTVVRDFSRLHIDTFRPERGVWPPGDGDVLLERTALQVAGVAIGDSMTVRLPGGEERTLRVAGTVHAPGLAPAWMEHMVPGFVGWGSIARSSQESAQIRIVVADHALDEGWIREVADSVRASLQRAGRVVSRVTVPAPGRHPHADQMEAFLFLLLAFGILSFALSAVIVAAMIQALMAEQVREVGILQAIGATRRQIATTYLGQVALLSVAALALGIPFGIVVGRAYAEFAAGILNANISQRPFPWWTLLPQVLAGVLLPLLATLGPVARASRLTVREALADDPAPPPHGAAGGGWLGGIPRPLLLPLRTTWSRPVRLAVTVSVLALGGAAFMSAMNVAAAWRGAVDRDFSARRYDLTIGFAEPVPVSSLDHALAAVPAVAHAEYWPGASPYLIGASGVPGGTVALVGPDAGSTLLTLPLTAGRWLRADDAGAAVVNRAVLVRNPTLGVGDSVRVRLAGRTASFPIVGVAKELAPMPVIYTTRAAVLAATGQPGDMARSVRVVTQRHDDAGQRDAARALERELERRGIEVSGLQRMLDVRQGIMDHLVIILAILTMASLVVVFVGAVGLASTLSLSVVQRTREFGVLAAIGATPRAIAGQVWLEALLIGLVSWVLANLIAAPASWALESACGSIFFKAPLDFTLSPAASAAWLGLVVLLASLSSVLPARRAAGLTVREALAHA